MGTLKMSDPSLVAPSSFVNGTFVEAPNPTLEVQNPCDGSVIQKIQNGTADDARTAVKAARASFDEWANTPVAERASMMQAIYKELQTHRKDLARLITMECGKPLKDALAEIDYGSSFFKWCAQPALQRAGSYIDRDLSSKFDYVTHTPAGIVAAITSWNFPIALLARKASAALAAGCPVVAKPSERAPLTGLALCVAAQRAGLPNGLLSAVAGDDGKAIIDGFLDGGVDVLSFTGSTRVGRKIGANAVAAGARVALELGGNAPLVVCEDADLEAAADAAVSNKLRCNGQTCVAINRILVHDSVHDEFVAKLRKGLEALRVGNGLDAETDLGPMIDDAAAKSTAATVAEAVDAGARIELGGSAEGAFMQPTLVTGVTDQMRLASEEVFAPVWSVLRFSEDKEGMRRANEHQAGLAAYVFARNISRIHDYTNNLRYGMIAVNSASVSSAATPFGGMRDSGFGREGGIQAIEAFSETKYCSVSL